MFVLFSYLHKDKMEVAENRRYEDELVFAVVAPLDADLLQAAFLSDCCTTVNRDICTA